MEYQRTYNGLTTDLQRTYNGLTTDLQRTYNGLTTDLQRTYNGPTTDLHRRELKVLTRLNKQKQVPYLTNLLPRERLAYANILFGNLRAKAQFLFGAKSRPVTSNR